MKIQLRRKSYDTGPKFVLTDEKGKALDGLTSVSLECFPDPSAPTVVRAQFLLGMLDDRTGENQ